MIRRPAYIITLGDPSSQMRVLSIFLFYFHVNPKQDRRDRGKMTTPIIYIFFYQKDLKSDLVFRKKYEYA